VNLNKTNLLLLLALVFATRTLLAADTEPSADMWGLCPHTAPQTVQALNGASRSAEQAPTYLNSDFGEGKLDGIYTLRGHVSIHRGPQQVEADQAIYDSQSGIVDATGNVLLQQGGLITQGDAAKVDIKTGTGTIDHAQYQYLQQHAHGSAASVTRESTNLTVLKHATYTTCDPGQVDWELRARTVKLDDAEAVGEAYNVSLRFKDVPFFYFPYINFPLNDQRKSGLLPPTFGYATETGIDLGAPVYWNIAPNHDATITPRIIGHRGLLTKGEFRYLTPDSQGQLQAEYLPHDRKFGSDRGTLEYQNQTRFNPHWNSTLLANYISDTQYPTDLGNSLTAASVTQVERRADLNYDNKYTSFLARLQGYQNLDPTLAASARPYHRLPQLLFTAATPAQRLGMSYRLDSEYVRFERVSSLTGTRVTVTPSLAWKIESQGYFFTPKIAMSHTQYQLNNQTPGAATDPSRTAPIYSIDSGLYLEREITLGKHSFLHTLEPRLYYLRVPYRDQSDLPLFDTGAFDFSFAQLFRDNRYSGPDRLGDTHQLSVAVTSRLLDADSGQEWLSGSIGQIIYLADRKVVLSGPPQTRERSDIVAEGSSRLSSHLTTTLELQWNPELHKVAESAIQGQYHMDDRHLINATYRFRRDQLTQTDLSFLWLLTPRWQVLGRWNYSQRDHRTLENLTGVQYESCCWIVRLTHRRYVNDLSGDSSRSLFLQLELKGLGSIGNSAKDVLESGILGYRPQY